MRNAPITGQNLQVQGLCGSCYFNCMLLAWLSHVWIFCTAIASGNKGYLLYFKPLSNLSLSSFFAIHSAGRNFGPDSTVVGPIMTPTRNPMYSSDWTEFLVLEATYLELLTTPIPNNIIYSFTTSNYSRERYIKYTYIDTWVYREREREKSYL